LFIDRSFSTMLYLPEHDCTAIVGDRVRYVGPAQQSSLSQRYLTDCHALIFKPKFIA
jgi:hypothetical protein